MIPFSEHFYTMLESMNDSYRTEGQFETEMMEVVDDDTGEDITKDVLLPVQIIRFTTAKNIEYLWYAKQNRYDDKTWEIAFGINKGILDNGANNIDINLQGSGDAFRILSTVADITNNFTDFGEYDVLRLTFTAKEENRKNLYIKRIVPRIDGFELEHVENIHGEFNISLIRNY